MINQRRESKWFNEVIVKMLDGKIEATIERLSEKQVASFGKFMLSDRTDYKGRRMEYDSQDGRYRATMTDQKYYTTLHVYDNFRRKAGNLISSIAWLKSEIELDGLADEWDTAKLAEYETQLAELTL